MSMTFLTCTLFQAGITRFFPLTWNHNSDLPQFHMYTTDIFIIRYTSCMIYMHRYMHLMRYTLIYMHRYKHLTKALLITSVSCSERQESHHMFQSDGVNLGIFECKMSIEEAE